MIMKNIFFILVLIGFTLPSSLMGQDAENCTDHPLISRFPASQIVWCNAEDFSEYHIATGTVTGYMYIDEWVDLEGKLYRYNYELQNTTHTMNEVYQNYRNALQKAGFEILTMGSNPNRDRSKNNQPGGQTWVQVAHRKNPLPQTSRSRLFKGSSSSGGYGYVAGKLEKPEGNVYAIVTTYQQNSSLIVVQIDILEEKPLDDGKITIDPDYLAREIATKGTVVLDGVYFDFDQAVVKPTSDASLASIATYLKQVPDAHFYVVGHTDYEGKLAYNLNLSQERASAVVDKLVDEYGIAPERLTAQGVGPLAPRTTNTTDVGRGKNRRVELVLSKT